VVTAHKIVEDLDGEVVGTLTMMERQKEPGLKAVGEGKKNSFQSLVKNMCPSSSKYTICLHVRWPLLDSFREAWLDSYPAMALTNSSESFRCSKISSPTKTKNSKPGTPSRSSLGETLEEEREPD
jgi:hypothetical protein